MMRVFKIIGIILVIAGIAMLATGSLHFRQKRKVLNTDVVDISRTETKVVSWPRIAGVVVIAGGVVLLLLGEKGKASAAGNERE
jgi:LPXTG-motif cell wall-anchored protein